MISLKDQRIVDLTWPIRSRLTRLDGTIEEGTRDVYDMPWIVEETVNQKDNTIEHLIGANVRTISDWPIAGTSGHMGSHIQLGVGHNDNWSGLPDGMLGMRSLGGTGLVNHNLWLREADGRAEPVPRRKPCRYLVEEFAHRRRLARGVELDVEERLLHLKGL